MRTCGQSCSGSSVATAAFVGFCVRACRSPPITTRRLRTVLRRRRPRPARAVRPCVAESNGIHFPWDIKGGILGDAATALSYGDLSVDASLLPLPPSASLSSLLPLLPAAPLSSLPPLSPPCLLSLLPTASLSSLRPLPDETRPNAAALHPRQSTSGP